MRGLTAIVAGGSGPDMVPYGTEGLYLLRQYAVEVDDPECPVLVEVHVEVIDGQPRCVELRCSPKPNGPPVSSEILRQIPLGRYVRQSAGLYSERWTVQGDIELHAATGSGDEPLLVRAAQRRPRRQMTDRSYKASLGSTEKPSRGRRSPSWRSST